MPDEAFREREVLAMQDIKSLIAVPLLSRDKVWGYAGIDIVNRPRRWTGEDFQWFSSLINIISLCIELQRSEREAQSERKYLQSLYHHMPLGYAQLRVIRDEQGKPVDLLVLMPTTPPTRSWGLRAKPISAGVSPNWDWIWSNI